MVAGKKGARQLCCCAHMFRIRVVVEGACCEPDAEAVASRPHLCCTLSAATNVNSAPFAWQSGETFIVHNAADLASTVLPKYFKHRNFTSLVRQLNMCTSPLMCLRLGMLVASRPPPPPPPRPRARSAPLSGCGSCARPSHADPAGLLVGSPWTCTDDFHKVLKDEDGVKVTGRSDQVWEFIHPCVKRGRHDLVGVRNLGVPPLRRLG